MSTESSYLEIKNIIYSKFIVCLEFKVDLIFKTEVV